MVTRSEGYERARGKEDPAIAVARDCIKHVIRLEAHVIQDPVRNRKHGDLELVGTAECKGQPIDPERYNQNFVEVFEDTTALGRDHHRDGFVRTAQLLRISPEQLAGCIYHDQREHPPPARVLGRLSHVSASLESIAGSDLTIYANADPARTFVYFYTRAFLFHHVREQVLANRMRRGQGNANEDTFGVFVPNSPARWRRVDGEWFFVGEGDPPIERIRAALTRPPSP